MCDTVRRGIMLGTPCLSPEAVEPLLRSPELGARDVLRKDER